MNNLSTDRTCLLLMKPGYNAFLAKSMTTGGDHCLVEDAVANGAGEFVFKESWQVLEPTRVVTHGRITSTTTTTNILERV